MLKSPPPPRYDWEQWIQLFEVAKLARHSISVSEVLREAGQQSPHAAALMGSLEESLQKGKSVICFSSRLAKMQKNADGQVSTNKHPTGRTSGADATQH